MEKNSAMPSVLIIDNNPERVILLVEILEASRYNVSAPLRLQQDITDQVSRLKPDIILIGVDFPGQAVLDWVAALYESYPCPTVMFSRDERPQTIQAATHAGRIGVCRWETHPRPRENDYRSSCRKVL